jgi:hypothetical protein
MILMSFNPWMLLPLAIVFAILYTLPWQYTTTETYSVSEPVSFVNTTTLKTVDSSGWLGLWQTRTASFSIMNNDTVSGSVTANFFYTNGIETLSKSTTQNLNAGEIKVMSVDIPTDSNATYATFDPSNKQVAKTGEVTHKASLMTFLVTGMGALK